MGIGYALGNVMLAARKYENWAEVMLATAQKREPAKIVLNNGLSVEATVGLRFLVREIFFARVYNPINLPIESNDIVVDIGANCGVFSLFAATRTHNVIHAFEPFPANFAVLQRNIARNNLRHVRAHASAVSAQVGTTELFLNLDDGQQNVLQEYVVPEKINEYRLASDLEYLVPQPHKTESKIQVPTTTLQAIMEEQKLSQIDFLKLDCEGSEGAILQATPVSDLKRVRKLALEFHDHLSPLHHRELLRLLHAAGFVTRLAWDARSPLGYIYAWR